MSFMPLALQMSTSDPAFWVMLIVAVSFVVIAVAMVVIALVVSRVARVVTNVELRLLGRGGKGAGTAEMRHVHRGRLGDGDADVKLGVEAGAWHRVLYL